MLSKLSDLWDESVVTIPDEVIERATPAIFVISVIDRKFRPTNDGYVPEVRLVSRVTNIFDLIVMIYCGDSN